RRPRGNRTRLARDLHLARARAPTRRLRAAASLAAATRPLLIAGDLLEEQPTLVAQVPVDATLVIFHSAVLVYLESPQRDQFVGIVRSLDAVWLSNEGAGILPGAPGSIRTADSSSVAT